MKNILLLLALVAPLSCFGQVWRTSPGAPTKTEERNLKGTTLNIQEVFLRDHVPVTAIQGPTLYIVTNWTDGIILCKTNITVAVRIGLPNPTNNIGRVFRIGTMGACTAILTNETFTGTFTAGNTMAEANQCLIASNKLASVFSTGTNYVVLNH